ncbi:MAG: peptidoglycan DD-metalloendopeptidase family protein [Oscillospiraceae bacterium]|nr:peptidoglycan DD-metalloendopeptidase family protein [Oscillospiraceae bacterium]
MNHKKIKLIALLSAACIALGCCIFPQFTNPLHIPTISAKTLEEINQEREEIRKQQEQKQQELEKLLGSIDEQEAYQAVLQEKIDLINRELSLIDQQLRSLNNDISDKESDIADLELRIADQQTDIDKGLETFKARVRTLYVHGNDSLLSALVGATDFYDVLAKIDLINRIAEHDDEMMNTLTAQLEALNENKADLDARVAALELKRTEVQSLRSEYDKSYQQLDAAMTETEEVKLELERQKNEAEAWISDYQNRLDTLSSEEDAILAEIKRQEEEKHKQEQTSPGNNPPVVIPPEQSGVLAWPVPGFYWISSPFGQRWGRQHRGIDIAGGGIHNAPITAAASGTVTKVVTGCPHDSKGFCGCGGGYGNYVIVTHSNGMSTLYAHMSRVAISVGTQVSAGTVLGYVGSTGNSTGYHLHFSVIINGTYVNPQLYL